MKVPFFNLKSKVKSDEDDLRGALDELSSLIKISKNNGKKVETIFVSDAVYRRLASYAQLDNKRMFGYKYKVLPDIAVIWEKPNKQRQDLKRGKG